MALASVQNLIFSLLIVVPGFIAATLATSLGVLREEVSKWRLLISSLTLSLLIDSLFLWWIQSETSEVTSPTLIDDVFFEPHFRPEFVFGLIGLSVAIGVIGGVVLTWNTHEKLRRLIWGLFGNNRHRHFHEPWEGVLDRAKAVEILTKEDELLFGYPRIYSDDGKERQLAIRHPYWKLPNDDEWVAPNADIELLFEEDIKQISVVTTNSTSRIPRLFEWMIHKLRLISPLVYMTNN